MKGFKPQINTSKNKAIRSNKRGSGEILFKQAIQHHAKGDLLNAEKLYRESIETGYYHPTIFLNLGIICQKSRRLKEAITLYKKAISLSPNCPISYTNLGNIYKNIGELEYALAYTLKSIELNPDNPNALMNLGVIYKGLGNLDKALSSTLKCLEIKPDNPNALMNLGGIYKDLGNLDQAISSMSKTLEIQPNNSSAHINLGKIYKSTGNLDQALAHTLKSLKLNPDNSIAYMNLGGIYKDLGKLDKALYSTQKSIKINPNNATAHTNLGAIYRDIGNLDQALSSTLKSLEIKSNNLHAINNLKGFIDQINLSAFNSKNLREAYELLINHRDVSHQKLSRVFQQIFMPSILKASASDPIASSNNEALKELAADWRFIKSLSLIIPPSPEVEKFFTKLRKELLTLAIQEKAIPPQLMHLTEALATQCFLNEYVYTLSHEEGQLVDQLITAAADSQEATNKYLAIIACYRAIHSMDINPEHVKRYPITENSSKELIMTQFKEPFQEEKIKAQISTNRNITNEVSCRVKKMYEENPYPRFKCANYTNGDLAIPTFKAIQLETTRQNQSFPRELSDLSAKPKVLIAGCGTGNQIINASRYKNAQITAIDLSSSSLAYAIRKVKEYKMDNVTFQNMDLLNVSMLGEFFDLIECSGVLHHMNKPSAGLSSLIQQLKPNGYIKLGLYSEIARKVIVEARKIIQILNIDSTPEGIREFRGKVLNEDFKGLSQLQRSWDFYSLSQCRDLCFHVQEHRFTTGTVEKLLNANGLTFCGFMVPEQIKKLYRKQYPEDSEMISLTNWGEFEEENPSTFVGMYQFWAQKKS